MACCSTNYIYTAHIHMNVINYHPSDDEESRFFFSTLSTRCVISRRVSLVVFVFFPLPSFHPYSFLVPYFFFYGCSPLCAARRGYNLLPALYRRFIIRSVSRPPPRRHHRACCFCFLSYFCRGDTVIQRSSIRDPRGGAQEEEDASV